MSGKENRQDMGTGSIKALMVKMALPAVLGQIVNLLYNIVDRIYIGHIPVVGASALTGVGLFTPILLLITAFAQLLGAGGAPLASTELGKGNKGKAEKIMGNCFSGILIMSVVLTVSLYFAAPAMLKFFGASPATMTYALDYARIYILGSVFVLTVMGMNLFISGQGFAKVSMLTIVIGAVINIILDPIFIFVLNMGVKGAAIATVISQAVGALWTIHFLRGDKTIIHLNKKGMLLRPKLIVQCVSLGSSTFIMTSTEGLLALSFTSSLAKYGGDTAVGSMTIMSSLIQLIGLPLMGLCQGVQPIISFNFGAGKNDRVKETFKTLFITCIIFTVSAWLALMICPGVFVGIFTSDKTLKEFASGAIRIYMALIFTFAFQDSCQLSFVALGQAKISLLLACFRKIILLIPMIFILPNFMTDKVTAVFLAEPVSDVIAATVTTYMFFTRFDKILKKGPGK